MGRPLPMVPSPLLEVGAKTDDCAELEAADDTGTDDTAALELATELETAELDGVELAVVVFVVGVDFGVVGRAVTRKYA